MFKNMKKPCKYVVFPVSTRFYGKAADGNRTRDLRTTNATLYRLSHSSLCPVVCFVPHNESNYIMRNSGCQQKKSYHEKYFSCFVGKEGKYYLFAHIPVRN